MLMILLNIVMFDLPNFIIISDYTIKNFNLTTYHPTPPILPHSILFKSSEKLDFYVDTNTLLDIEQV